MGSEGQKTSNFNLKELALVLLLTSAISVLFFNPYFHLFFIYDDIPTLRISVPALGNNFLSIFSPMSNGFWRPKNRLLVMVSTGFFGLSPFPIHCLGVLIHILNGFLLFVFMRVAIGLDLSRSLLGTALFQCSLAGSLAVIQPGNFADLTVLTGVLITLNASLILRGPFGIAVFAFGLVVGFASKEVFVLIPCVVAIAHFCGWGRGSFKEVLPKIIFCSTLSIFYVVGLIYSLSHVEVTYVSDGRVDLHGFRILRRLSDYFLSMFFPYIHVFEFPAFPIALPHFVLWMLRIVVILFFCYSIFNMATKKDSRGRYGLIAISVLFLLLPSCIGFETASRYLYAPTAFAVAFIVSLIPLRKIWIGILCAYGLFILLPGAWFSPSLRKLRETGSHVESLVESLRDQKGSIPAGSSVAIYEHPHIAAKPYDWVYRQLIFDVFFPEEKWRYFADSESSGADVVIRYSHDEQSTVWLGGGG